MVKTPETRSVSFVEAPTADSAKKILSDLCSIAPARPYVRTVSRVAIYGAGKLGKMACDMFDRLGVEVVMVLDRNALVLSHEPFWKNIPLYSPDSVPKSVMDTCLLAVCVANNSFNEVMLPLRDAGWKHIVPFYDYVDTFGDEFPLSNGWYSNELSPEDVFGIESVLYRWHDNQSRAHHLQFIAWHYLREEWTFADSPVELTNRFFIKEILDCLNQHEVFLDIGAHSGEVLSQFLDIVDHKYSEIHLFEPDELNLERLKRRIDELPKRNHIYLHGVALDAKSTRRRFFSKLGYASQFSEFGDLEIDSVALDSFNIKPSFMKIHVEGWEPHVVSGALSTIMERRPILAITSYHQREGLWSLPAMLMTALQDYQFIFRVHSWHGTGAVIYAIPRERVVL